MDVLTREKNRHGGAIDRLHHDTATVRPGFGLALNTTNVCMYVVSYDTSLVTVPRTF